MRYLHEPGCSADHRPRQRCNHDLGYVRPAAQTAQPLALPEPVSTSEIVEVDGPLLAAFDDDPLEDERQRSEQHLRLVRLTTTSESHLSLWTVIQIAVCIMAILLIIGAAIEGGIADAPF